MPEQIQSRPSVRVRAVIWPNGTIYYFGNGNNGTDGSPSSRPPLYARIRMDGDSIFDHEEEEEEEEAYALSVSSARPPRAAMTMRRDGDVHYSHFVRSIGASPLNSWQYRVHSLRELPDMMSAWERGSGVIKKQTY